MLSTTTRLFILTFATFAAMHALLLRLFLYWRYEWLDIPMHFFGGAIVALGVFAARDLQLPFARAALYPPALIAIVLSVALLWEAFEFFAGISVMQENFWADTTLDLILGLIGGAFGLLLGRKLAAFEETV